MNETLSESTLILSLFCGAGGLDFGFKSAGFRIAMAVDNNQAAIATHKLNFPDTESHCVDLLDTTIDDFVNLVLRNIPRGSRLGIIGGPPCQGFSRANTRSYVGDPRNTLPGRYLDIVKSLSKLYFIDFVIFENVMGIKDKKHKPIYDKFVSGLSSAGFECNEDTLCSLDYGVPQNRMRIVLSCLNKKLNAPKVKVVKSEGLYTVRDAIEGLCDPAFFKRNLPLSEIPYHQNHWTMQPKSSRFKNPDSVINTLGRSFRRLKWDEPSPTVAYGHREIHVHPSGKRRLSIYEALILQGFPHSFTLIGNFSEQVEQVSNAVPPPLAYGIAKGIINCLSSNGLKGEAV